MTPPEELPPFRPCEPSSFGGYDKSRTVYNNVTHRVFNLLVETSNAKIPPESTLGNSQTLSPELIQTFLPATQTIGHIPRNMRLALMMIEMVRPYVLWTFSPILQPVLAERAALQDYAAARGCKETAVQCKAAKCNVEPGAIVQLSWEILGSFTVDSTSVVVASDPRFDQNSVQYTSANQSGYTRYVDHPQMLYVIRTTLCQALTNTMD